MNLVENSFDFADTCLPVSGVPELPSRPGPGHPLYHHMMKAAHGVALHDFTGSLQDELSFKVRKLSRLRDRERQSCTVSAI